MNIEQLPVARNQALFRLLRIAAWLGIAGFGGGFAIVQQLKAAAVEREHWVREDEFLESFSVATALPGTPGTNLLTILGVRFAGSVGGILSTALFLLPSVCVMIAFGALYTRVRSIGPLAAFLDGMSVATVGVVAGVAADVGRGSLKRRVDWVLAIASACLLAGHWLTLLEVIALSGLWGALLLRPNHDSDDAPKPTNVLRSTMGRYSFALPLAAVASLPTLLFVFARIGVATFGGGFAMIPAIEHEIVANRHWLSEPAFNDAIVLGQITPGPVAIAATFIGYRVAGLAGAVSATVGMFAPPMMLSILAGRSLTAFRSNLVVQGALRGIAPAMTGIIAAAAVALWRTSVHGLVPGLLAVTAAVVLVAKRRVPPLLVLASGGLVMVLLGYVR